MEDKVKKVLFELNRMFPDAKGELVHRNSFELLIAVVLSAQTTDKAVNVVTQELFLRYPCPELLALANQTDVEKIINRIGLYKTKAQNIINIAKILVSDYKGNVPNSRIELEKLPGVGRKTSNVVLSIAFDIPAIAVDTHVERVSKRLGLADKGDNVLKVEQKLMLLFPKNKWTKLHHQLIFFGRYHCTARSPKCSVCPLFNECNYPAKNK
ncbi:MAG: endonuclease III [Acholeplasma sp.]|nr:endonuclease III [Acholeplasma sp.]